MLTNYLKLAFRNLLKHRSYSFINILGLAIGIAGCLLILLYVQEELSYDRFHERAGRIYRVTLETARGKLEVTPSIVGPLFQREFPQVERSARFYETTKFGAVVVRHGEKIFQEERFMYADSTVFFVFSFPFVSGNPATALTRPNTLVLTQTLAQKYFGNANPLGQTLRVNNALDFEVTGVIADVPRQSHLQFDFLASYVSLTNEWAKNETWGSANLYTYVLLNEATPIAALETQGNEFLKRSEAADYFQKISLQKITRIHLYWDGDITNVYIFSTIAFLLLLIACINYMNLATARSARRAREVGVRKVLGAPRAQLALQFYGEIGLMTLIALIIAVFMVELALPAFNSLSGKSLAAFALLNSSFVLMIIAIGLLVSLIAGSYPALFLSNFQAAHVLKAARKMGGQGSGFRKGLVVLQFVIAIVLISGTMVVSDQLGYMRSKKLGFAKEHVLILPMRERTIRENYPALKGALAQHANILSVSGTAGFPGRVLGGYTMAAEGLAEADYPSVTGYQVDSDIIKTLGLELIAGAGFPSTWKQEQGYVYVINERALQALGWQAEEAVGKWMDLNGRRGRVVGVVKDFHFASLHETIGTLAMFLEPREFKHLLVKVGAMDLQNTLAFMRAQWREFAPNSPFEFSFLDREFEALYRSEQRAGSLINAFAVLAIFVACLGLFGLASFTAEQRTKEIGVRKVLGASVANLVGLLSQDFLKLVLFAFIIALPLAWLAMNHWLQNFAYRIALSPWVFALAGCLALIIALLTVSSQAIKAALTNPVEALRYE